MKIGVLGYGVVAKALIKQLNTRHSDIQVVKILRRKGKATEANMVDNLQAILEDDTIDGVVELMGGIHPDYEYLCAALNVGKHVITANKALLNVFGDELNHLAQSNNVSLLFSAACGGGIPILPTLIENKANGIVRISGILNGTTNYILDEMESKGIEYSVALKHAQELGYAEADASSDLEGMDALYKIRLACAVGMGQWIEIESALVEGITSLKKADIQEIHKLGYKLRLIAQVSKINKHYEMSVEPCLVNPNSAFGSTLENHNLAIIQMDQAETIVLSGQGAGGDPTASNVMRDLLAIKSGQKEMFPKEINRIFADQSQQVGRYMIRTAVESSAFKDIEDHSWHALGYRYLITQEVLSREIHKNIHELRKHEDIFFAKFEETR